MMADKGYLKTNRIAFCPGQHAGRRFQVALSAGPPLYNPRNLPDCTRP
nr:hypothetical protein [Eikenella sp. NML97-A-109]